MTVLDKINALQAKHFLVLFVIENGKVFYLPDHYKYLKPEKQAKRELLGKADGLKEGQLYVTHQLKKL